MNTEDIETRLAGLEHRLGAVEKRLGIGKPLPAAAAPEPDRARQDARTGAAEAGFPLRTGNLSTTRVLGWSGATALVFAAVYLVRLGVDSGWLTPLRQVILAALGGFALISAGLLLRRSEREYAAYLPAAGVAVLYLSVYAAHVHYALIGAIDAVAAITTVSAATLWLGRLFAAEIYPLFAAFASYTAPLFLPGLRGGMLDVTLYFTAWSLVFSVYAIWLGQRVPYVVAMYLALSIFYMIFDSFLREAWQGALVFQTIQFAIFLTAAVGFSVRHRAPLTREGAIAHAPALVLFYALQYHVLDRNLPAAAPWIAVASALVLWLAYLPVPRYAGRDAPAGRFLVSAYAALVLTHALYLRALPDSYAPWAAAALFCAIPLVARVTGLLGLSERPFQLAIGMIVFLNFTRVGFDFDMANVPGWKILAVLYPVLAYAAYHAVRSRETSFRGGALWFAAVGHASAMAACARLISSEPLVSMAWVAIAAATLVVGFRLGERDLARSSLVIFALAGAKIMLFDLAEADPILRIVALLVLGVALYGAGVLYRRIEGAQVGAQDVGAGRS